MANKQFLTLLDLTAATGTDTSIGVVKVIQVHAPELELFSGRPIAGTTFEVTRARALPAGNAFRPVNAPVLATAGKYEKILGQCFRIDRPIQVDQALIEAAMATYGGTPEDLQADQVAQQMQALGILLGQQFYYGTTIDGNGFDGCTSFVDNSKFTCIDAGGGASSGNLSSAWLIYNHPQGVHWTFGGGKGLQSGVWMPQQIQKYMNGTSGQLGIVPMYVNNVFGWLGLANNAPLSRTNKTDLISVVRIANLTSFAGGKGLTDSLIAQAKKLFPLSISSNPGALKLMMSRQQNLALVLSRMVLPTTSASSSLTVSTPMQFGDVADVSCGIPIHMTDSILDTEASITIA